MSENERHFFVCALGPVQDFIATARTSQDLWFGSWMLSELAKSAARVILDESHRLVFPAPERKQDLDPGSELNVANKIVAIIEQNPDTVATAVLQAVNGQLEKLYKETRTKINGPVNQELAEKQILDLVEFYWASVPYEEQRDYKKARAQAEAVLAARKNTRNFRQVNGCKGVLKSSLDGFRESVLLGNSSAMGADAFYSAYHAEQGESLSGVDLLKRWGNIEARTFPSTTDLAAKPFLVMIGEEKKRVLLQRIETLLKEYTHRTETQGTLFYQDRLAQLISDRTKRSEFGKRFAKVLGEEDIHQGPSPYYVLLLADGDNMGKTIHAQDSLEKHRRLSQRLSEFAMRAQRIIAAHDGVPIYVGGDDVLAYFPLHTAMQCFSELDDTFSSHMKGFGFEENGELCSPGLSGALVIAHHLTPLGEVLEMARQAEKEAKGIPGKNGLAIVLSKRSSADRMASAKVNNLIERMWVLIAYTRQKQISTGTAYELGHLHQQLGDVGLPLDAIQREAIRIIQRKRESGGEREIQQEVRQQFESWLRDQDLSLEELAQEMVIAGELAKAHEMAKVSLTSGEKETQT